MSALNWQTEFISSYADRALVRVGAGVVRTIGECEFGPACFGFLSKRVKRSNGIGPFGHFDLIFKVPNDSYGTIGMAHVVLVEIDECIGDNIRLLGRIFACNGLVIANFYAVPFPRLFVVPSEFVDDAA